MRLRSIELRHETETRANICNVEPTPDRVAKGNEVMQVSAITAGDTAALPGQRRDNRFYVAIAASSVLISYGGFAGTYWLQWPQGTFVGHAVVHLHAILFSAWPLFFLAQTLLVANGRVASHRTMGLVGISLATAMIFIGLAASIDSLSVGLAAGYGDRVRAFMIVPVSAIATFGIFFAAAIANISRPDWHKRYMIVATAFILGAAIARVFFIVNTGGGPGLRPGLAPPIPVLAALGPGMVAEMIIGAGMFYDWRTRGRPHPAYLVGLIVTMAVMLGRAPVSETQAWLDFARFLGNF